MKKTLLEAYALSVCFFTLICFVLVLAMAVYSAVQINNPMFTMSSWNYEKYQSNDNFWNDKQRPREYEPRERPLQERPSEIELSKQREQAFASAIAMEKREGMQMFFKLLIIMLLNIVIFSVHWMMARR